MLNKSMQKCDFTELNIKVGRILAFYLSFTHSTRSKKKLVQEFRNRVVLILFSIIKPKRNSVKEQTKFH